MKTERRPLAYDDFWDLQIVSDVQVSPDGGRAAYTVLSFNRSADERRSSIWIMDLSSGDIHRLTSGETYDSQPRWSPDSEHLAFISARHDSVPQVYVISAHGGEVYQVTRRADGASSPAWSPDSRRILFVSRTASDEQAMPREREWVNERNDERGDRRELRRITGVLYRFDGRGFTDKRSHIFVIDRDGENLCQLTGGVHDEYDPVWSPDGRSIAFCTNRTIRRDFNWVTDIWVLDIDSGEEKRLTDGTLSASCPCWSPDGSMIAFYAAPDWFEHGSRNTHVWCVSRQGGDQHDLIPDHDYTRGALYGDYGPDYPFPPEWSPDGSCVYFSTSRHGSELVCRVAAEGGTVTIVTPEELHIVSCKATPDGQSLVCCAATATQPYELFCVSLSSGHMEQLTFCNRPLLDRVVISEPERFIFHSVDDWEIEGWIIRPVMEGESPLPLVVHVHGGPNGMFGNTFYFNMQVLAGAGMACMYVNPRGSGGYGEQYLRAADWGGKDYEDIMRGIDHLVAKGGLDDHRIAITGSSFGGFMTNWAVGQSDRFACAVAVNSIANLVSYYGTSDLAALWFLDHMHGPPWENWEHYVHHSPIYHVARVNTPLLLIHSEQDLRCPIEQAEQMYMALKMRGSSVEMVRIPDASHSIANSAAPRHCIERWRLTKEWFDRYLRSDDGHMLGDMRCPECGDG